MAFAPDVFMATHFSRSHTQCFLMTSLIHFKKAWIFTERIDEWVTESVHINSRRHIALLLGLIRPCESFLLNVSFGDLKVGQFTSGEGPVVLQNRNSEPDGSTRS